MGNITRRDKTRVNELWKEIEENETMIQAMDANYMVVKKDKIQLKF